MYTLLIIVHILVSFALVIVVLLQQGQSSDLSGIFGGGGGSGPIIGGQSAMSLMNKITVGAFILFLFTSISISIYQSKRYQREKTLQQIEEKIPIDQEKKKPGSPIPQNQEKNKQSASPESPAQPPATQQNTSNSQATEPNSSAPPQ